MERNCEVHHKIDLLKEDRTKLWEARAKLEHEKKALMERAAQVAEDVRTGYLSPSIHCGAA